MSYVPNDKVLLYKEVQELVNKQNKPSTALRNEVLKIAENDGVLLKSLKVSLNKNEPFILFINRAIKRKINGPFKQVLQNLKDTYLDNFSNCDIHDPLAVKDESKIKIENTEEDKVEILGRDLSSYLKYKDDIYLKYGFVILLPGADVKNFSKNVRYQIRQIEKNKIMLRDDNGDYVYVSPIYFVPAPMVKNIKVKNTVFTVGTKIKFIQDEVENPKDLDENKEGLEKNNIYTLHSIIDIFSNNRVVLFYVELLDGTLNWAYSEAFENIVPESGPTNITTNVIYEDDKVKISYVIEEKE